MATISSRSPSGLNPPSVPLGVWVLGLVSLLMDVSSEMIHSLLPVFMTSALGASVALVGLVEGLAESVALIVKVFSGTLSDHWGRRKGLALAGYGLGAASKPLFALASSMPWVLFARFTDRIGKGIRGAPRDALIADLTEPEVRGRAYGVRQSLDTAGSIMGPAAALLLISAFAGDFRRVFWVAVIPGALSVLLLGLGVEEPDKPRPSGAAGSPVRWDAWARLGPAYWKLVAVGALFTLARLTEAFLVLRGQDAGLSIAQAPAVMILMNLVYTAGAYPAGVLADRMNRRTLLAAGLVILVLAEAALAGAGGLWLAGVGIALWGLHMALTQGLLSVMIADAAAPDLRGTAFGIFNLACGVAMLAAGIGAGLLWDHVGPAATFSAGAVVALASLALVLTL